LVKQLTTLKLDQHKIVLVILADCPALNRGGIFLMQYHPTNFHQPIYPNGQLQSKDITASDDSLYVRRSKLKVLVVDDVSDSLTLCSLVLKQAGYDPVTASSAEEAIAAAKRSHFDLVLSDIGMGNMNGYELARQLREMPEYLATPLVAVTGYEEYGDHHTAFSAGFNAHLKKPYDPAKLLEIVARLTPWG
jgi:CheY-like chemotaxis protein